MRDSIILLASGTSARFGSNKLMEFFRGRRLIEYALLSALLSFVGDVIIVKSPDLVIEESIREKVKVIENNQPALGISHSIALGVREVRDRYDATIISLGDQPFIPSRHYKRLHDIASIDPAGIVYTQCDSRIGNPALFHSKYFRFLSTMFGDEGAKKVISDNFTDSTSVDIEDCGFLMDIDTIEDLATARSLIDRLYPDGLY